MNAFKLDEEFIQQYKDLDPGFGFNGLGELTFYRTYSRKKPDGSNEAWYETIRRVVEGAYTLQLEHIMRNELGWNHRKGQKSAQEMYDRMFHMKFLPPGRMLWALGTPLIHQKRVGQALFNCAFVSTKNITASLDESIKPFTFMMDMSMVGVGVGFDVIGADKLEINAPSAEETETFVIPDSREGWVKSLEKLLFSYFSRHFGFTQSIEIEFDYSVIRGPGLPIKGFGGVSSGPEPLKKMHNQIRDTLHRLDGKCLTVAAITDIMNLIGQCVVAGNVRRTAQIVLGDVNDRNYRRLKDYYWNPETQQYEGSMAHRAAWGWASNNSVVVGHDTDFSEVAAQIAVNGEPGVVFLENMRDYGRMGDPADFKDRRAAGTNPCAEQTLESYELCCLVETFPSRAESREDFLRTLKFAYLLGKTATLVNTSWPETNRVQKRNRRIGTSVSGVTDFLDSHSLDTFRDWLDSGYQEIQRWDEIYSSWLCVPRSIKTTSVKPSGTVSLLAGVNPGCHFPENKYFIRRVRLSKDSPLLIPLKKAGIHLEEDVVDPSSMVASFPVSVKGRTLDQVSIWEQVSLAAFLQRYWSDNQVSCTVTFRESEAGEVAIVLDYFRYSLKAISFLPKLEKGAYAQMPYEAITEEHFSKIMSELETVQYQGLDVGIDGIGEKFCGNDTCELTLTS